MLLRKQAGGKGLIQHPRKKLVRNFALKQAVAVPGESRVMPHLVIHREAHKPAKQKIVVDLHHQLPLAADCVKYHQKLRPK